MCIVGAFIRKQQGKYPVIVHIKRNRVFEKKGFQLCGIAHGCKIENDKGLLMKPKKSEDWWNLNYLRPSFASSQNLMYKEKTD